MSTLAAAPMQSPAPVQAVVGGSNSAPNAHTVAAFLRMLEKARKEGVIVYRNADGSGTVPSAAKSGAAYIVRRTGAKWFNLSCTCAAAGHIACKHRAVYAFAWKYGIWAARPAVASAKPAAPICETCGTNIVVRGGWRSCACNTADGYDDATGERVTTRTCPGCGAPLAADVMASTCMGCVKAGTDLLCGYALRDFRPLRAA